MINSIYNEVAEGETVLGYAFQANPLSFGQAGETVETGIQWANGAGNGNGSKNDKNGTISSPVTPATANPNPSQIGTGPTGKPGSSTGHATGK